MLEEILEVKLREDSGNIVVTKLYLYEENPEHREYVKLELYYRNRIFECSEINYFDALLKLRENLEQEKIQILCKGANKNVHPSAMQLNIGTGRSAYMLTIHKQAKIDDVVDIFESSDIEKCTSIAEQKHYFDLWIESLGE